MSQNNKQTSNVSEFNRYLDNNTEILKQKYQQHYAEPFPVSQLTQQTKMEKTLKYIYDIFNFHKYQSNPELNNTLKSSLVQNVGEFMKKQTGMYDSQMAVLMLKYCIEHNDMFAVHYDKKKGKKGEEQQQQKHEQKKQEEQQPQQIVQQEENKQEQKQIKQSQVKQTPAKIEKSPQRSQQIKFVQEIEASPSNQFQEPPAKQKQQNTQLIKKQLKQVFQFYCKQQQNVGPNFTFDNISHKCKTMNLGKFVTFAKTVNILHSKDKLYSQGKIQKNQLINAFKKAAQGHRQIGFNTFMSIIQQLKKYDNDLYQKLGLGQQGSKGKNKLLQNLKYLNLPFSTRDPRGRQPSQYGKPFIPKLTTHSGKYEQSLRDQLSSRKLRLSKGEQPSRIQSKLSSHSRIQGQDRNIEDNAKFKLKLGDSNNNLDNADLNFLSKLITQQQNDDVFLKDYVIPNSRRSHKGSQYNSRYDEQSTSLQQTKAFPPKLGSFTSRAKKADSFILPTINRKGGQTENNSIRRSLGGSRRTGTKANIY